MIVRTSVLWKMIIHMANKWPGMVIQRKIIKGHSFVYRLYNTLRQRFFSTFVAFSENPNFSWFVFQEIFQPIVRDVHIDCSKQFNRIYTFMCLGRASRFGQYLNCFKIQIRNLNRLLHIYNSMYGAGYKLEKQNEKPMI